MENIFVSMAVGLASPVVAYFSDSKKLDHEYRMRKQDTIVNLATLATGVLSGSAIARGLGFMTTPEISTTSTATTSNEREAILVAASQVDKA